MVNPAVPFITTGAYPTRSGNQIQPWIDGELAFRRICAAIAAAEQNVWVSRATLNSIAWRSGRPAGRSIWKTSR